MNYRHCCVFVALLLLTSCYFPSDSTLFINHYPLAAGNSWHYIRQISLYNARPSHPGDVLPETTMTFFSDVNVLDNVILKGISCSRCQIVEHEGDQILTSYEFYRSGLDSLRIIAYSGGSVSIYPQQKLQKGIHFTTNGVSVTSLEQLSKIVQGRWQGLQPAGTDSLYYEPGPVTSYIFPVRPVREWDYRLPNYPPGWRIHKKVTDIVPIAVGNSIIQTYKIQWYWDMTNSGKWDSNRVGFDYLSSRGLLKREYLINNLLVSSSSLDTLGLMDYKEEYDLQTMTVK
jgi:hypothetical protein